MKTLNNYTFRSWHNGVGEWLHFTVQAPNVLAAYDEALQKVHNTPGLSVDVSLEEASVLQVWEAAVTSEEVGFERFFVQAYTCNEATLAAEAYIAEHYGEAKLFYVLEELEEVK